MRLQNLDHRATTASNDLVSELRSTAQNGHKSFNSRASSNFGTTLSELEAAEGTGEGGPKNISSRQNLVATVSNSRASLAATSSPVNTPGKPVQPVAPLVANASPAPTIVQPPAPTVSGLQGLVDAADITSNGPKSNSSNSSSPKDTPPTPAAPPTLYSVTQGLSTDPSVFTTGNYFEQLNYSFYLQQANNENSLRYQNYTTEFQNWQLNGSQGQPPAAPVYETIDQNSFNAWYAQVLKNSSLGENGPDVSMFMANGPDYGNGYYGAVGTTQVGTLYNPTGPATPAQIAAANAAAPSTNNSTHT